MPPKKTLDLESAIQASPDLSAISKKNYAAKMRILSTRAEKPIDFIATHPDTYIPLIQTWYPNPTSYKAHFSTILSLFRYNPAFKAKNVAHVEKWATSFRGADDEVSKRYESNQPSAKQLAGYVAYSDIIKARDELPIGHLHRLLLGCYTYIRPLRCEFGEVAIYKSRVPVDDPAPNHILINGNDTATLVIKNFKTQKHHDAFNIALPEPFVKDIATSLDDAPRKWLFVNANQDPYGSKQFSKWASIVFEKIFKRPLTVSLIRHSFINELDFNSMSIVDKKEVASAMGHTVAMQDKYRLLFDKKECDCTCTKK